MRTEPIAHADIKPGMRVRHEAWNSDMLVDIRYVDPDGGWFAGVDEDADPVAFEIHRIDTWLRVVTPKPLPERWIRLVPNLDGAVAHVEEVEPFGRSFVVHVWTDADGNDHAEVTRGADL